MVPLPQRAPLLDDLDKLTYVDTLAGPHGRHLYELIMQWPQDRNEFVYPNSPTFWGPYNDENQVNAYLWLDDLKELYKRESLRMSILKFWTR